MILVDYDRHKQIYKYIYPSPSHEHDATQGQFFSGVQQVWVSSFLLLDWLSYQG